MVRKYSFVFLLVFMIGMFPLLAQDEPDTQPFLIQMMQAAPPTRSMVSYANYAAIEASGITPATIDNFAQFDSDDDAQSRWIQRSYRISAGPQLFNYLRMSAEMPATVGFDIFDIDRALSFGVPPTQGLILGGAFDLAAVGAAHKTRGYTLNNIEGVSAWCGTNGCDGGLQQDLINRNQANIFDPALGRQPPVLLIDDTHLASAFDWGVAQQMARAATGTSSSLADDPDYGAAALALTDLEVEYGTLLQVLFMPFSEINHVDYSAAQSPEDFEDMISSLNLPYDEAWQDFGDLPAYTLVALADFENADRQSAVIALVYTQTEDAQVAGKEVTKRIMRFNGALVRGADNPPFVEEIEGAEVVAPLVVEVNDRAIALITVHYPLVDDSQGDVRSGLLFNRWVQSIYARAFDPIWQIKLPVFD